MREGGKWGFIDHTGKVVIAIKYEGVDSFRNGRAEVRLDNKVLYIDKTGKEIADQQKEEAIRF